MTNQAASLRIRKIGDRIAGLLSGWMVAALIKTTDMIAICLTKNDYSTAIATPIGIKHTHGRLTNTDHLN